MKGTELLLIPPPFPWGVRGLTRRRRDRQPQRIVWRRSCSSVSWCGLFRWLHHWAQ